LRFLLSIEEEELWDNVADIIASFNWWEFVANAIFECHAHLQQNFAALQWIDPALRNLPVRLWSFCSHSLKRLVKRAPCVSLSSWTWPWILLRGLQARVRVSSPATVFGLQYWRRGSCHTPVLTWRPCISGRRSSGMEHVTAQCHLRAVPLFIPTTFGKSSVPATTASNNVNYCVVVLKCLHWTPR